MEHDGCCKSCQLQKHAAGGLVWWEDVTWVRYGHLEKMGFII